MCGIAGIISLNGSEVERIDARLDLMGRLIAHRGPDGAGRWSAEDGKVGLAHRRLTIIDLTENGAQPMLGDNGTALSFNGEIYNYRELQATLSDKWRFKSSSDTETILAAYAHYGDRFLDHLRGMFAFALFDERKGRLIAARDRFGIKPFYYAEVNGTLYFASEIKALLPFLPSIETDREALAEYLTFQYTLDELTLFAGVKELPPGHCLIAGDGTMRVERYWDVQYEIDWDHSSRYFHTHLRELLDDSIDVHLRSDVPIGGYMSGGIDSSLISILASRYSDQNRDFFHGKFTDYPGHDESDWAQMAADRAQGTLHQIDITSDDFTAHLSDIIYHLDVPVAGPGSFPQFMVSKLAAKHVKVVLGGQGGDEIFGGYARYLLAYLEQCLNAALDGSYKNGNYVVTIESIVPNLGLLREYKPMMREFWREGLFGEIDKRYFRLVNRASDMVDEVDWSELDQGRVFDSFRSIFNAGNVRKEAYFDKMTHFDFKCLLPALLQVEDRMSMAHGLESRVPMLDQKVVEFAASVPADVKFQGGRQKLLLKEAFSDVLPEALVNRRDKMGFPVPLKPWFQNEIKDFVGDIFTSQSSRERALFNSAEIMKSFADNSSFSRKTWGLLSLELWHQMFHDRSSQWAAMLDNPEAKPPAGTTH